MDIDLINNIITSSVTLIVGAIGAIVAYFGTIKGAKIQIKNEQKKLEKANEEQNEFAKESIRKFLSNEIKYNFIRIHTPFLEKNLIKYDVPFGYNLPHGYNYTEYNNLKYELIKFKSNEVEEIINIYHMFYLVDRKRQVSDFTPSEYDNFKKAYVVCMAKYHNI